MAKKLLSKELETQSIIHLHTDIGSVGDGAGKIPDYMKKFSEIGVEYATITDHGDLSGILEFYTSCKKNGINPGIGCEFYLNDKRDSDSSKIRGKKTRKKIKDSSDVNEEDGDDDEYNSPDDFKNSHLIVVAKNFNGIQSIIKLNNEAVLNGFYMKPRTTTEKVFELLGNDVLVSSACLAGFPARMIMNNEIDRLKKTLSKWKERFGEDFYLELQFNELEEQHVVNKELMKLGKELGIKTIVAQDCHYVQSDDHFLQMLKTLNRAKLQLSDLEDGIPKNMWIFNAIELYVKSGKEIIDTAKKFNYDITQNEIIQSLINNKEWHHKSNTYWDLSVKHYNEFKPPKGFKSSEEYFIHIVTNEFKNFIDKGYIPKDKKKEYGERIKYEINILIKKGYVDYLLETKEAIDTVVEKIGNRSHIGVGRGSASASLCAYLLGIHKVDPIKHDLLFDRFLSEARSNEMIDIDP